ncbi:MAG: DUF192 domain-containing protein [Candidatus Omnitrophota bacterium]
MQIINNTKNTVLAENAAVADTILKRMKGLLGRKDFKEGEALILKPCNSVHTFFMSLPIDVVFVDSNNKIVKTISVMPPFRLSRIYFKASLAIELPAGTIAKTTTKSGDFISC